MPTLSILVPTYNRAPYLRGCLDGLLATSVDCEILVSDNASTDETQAVLASYTDARLRCFRQPHNVGFMENHNFLLARASGSYLCLFGDDDLALPGCFETKVAVLEAAPHIDLVYSLAAGIDAEGQTARLARVTGQAPFGYLGGRDEFPDLLVACYISWQTLVFRREVYAQVGPLSAAWGLQAALDWYWLQLCVRGRQTAFLAEPTVAIRMHDQSHTRAIATQQGHFVLDKLRIWQKWLLEDANPPFIDDARWQALRQSLLQDVANAYGQLPAAAAPFLQTFAQLRSLYLQRCEGRLLAVARTADPFQADAAPLALAEARRFSFLYHPDWARAPWREVLLAYARAFAADDDVSLVLWLDPAQGLTAETLRAQVEALWLDAGLASEVLPDILLVPDACEATELASLYARANCLVASGDRLQLARAARMQRPVLADMAPAAWRAAARAKGILLSARA